MKWLSVIIVAVVASGHPAAAQAPDQDTQAKARFQHGQAFYDQGRYQDALVEFSASYELSHRALLLFNIAECQRLVGDVVQARATYQRYLDAEPDGQLVALAKDRITKLGGHETTLAPAPALNPKPVDLDPKKVVHDDRSSTLPPAVPLVTRDGKMAFYKRWPFWAGVGATVVVSSVAIYAIGHSGGSSCNGCEVVNLRD